MLPKLDAPHTVRCILPGTAQKGSTPLRRRNQLMKTAFFPPKILNHLPADNFEALAALCAEFERFDGHARQMPEHHDDYVEALSILRAFATAREAKVAAFPELGPQRHQNVARRATCCNQLRNHVRNQLTTP